MGARSPRVLTCAAEFLQLGAPFDLLQSHVSCAAVPNGLPGVSFLSERSAAGSTQTLLGRHARLAHSAFKAGLHLWRSGLSIGKRGPSAAPGWAHAASRGVSARTVRPGFCPGDSAVDVFPPASGRAGHSQSPALFKPLAPSQGPRRSQSAETPESCTCMCAVLTLWVRWAPSTRRTWQACACPGAQSRGPWPRAGAVSLASAAIVMPMCLAAGAQEPAHCAFGPL